MTSDEEIARMCAWLKQNKMVGQTTLAGKLTLTPKAEAVTAMLFGAQDVESSRRAKPSL